MKELKVMTVVDTRPEIIQLANFYHAGQFRIMQGLWR